MRKQLLISLGAAAFLISSPVAGKGLKWMDASGVGLPAGGKIAVVSGDPSKDGPFEVRIKMPANYTVPPHHHPADEVVRVTSAGALIYGMMTDQTSFDTATRIAAGDDGTNYDRFAIALHWTTAVLVVLQFALGQTWGWFARPTHHLMVVTHMETVRTSHLPELQPGQMLEARIAPSAKGLTAIELRESGGPED